MGILDHPSSSGSQSGHPRGNGTIASTSSSTGKFGIDWAKWFPPVTSRSFLSHYLPASGAVSHTLYTVHLFSPNIISSLFPTGDLAVSNTILFNANVGLGFYVYFRRHLHRVNPWERVEFSVLSSTLFNFGSLLAAVLIKALFPAKSPTWLKSLTATVLSGYLLSRAAKYMGLLDHRTSSSNRSSVSPARSVLSPRHTAQPVSATSSRRQSVRSNATSSRFSPPDALHLDISSGTTMMAPETILETPPQSQEQNAATYAPMTPSATEHTSSEFDGDLQQNLDDGEGGRQNYRYLHSFALNNLNYGTPKKETILRRTTMNQTSGNPNPKSQKTFLRRPSETATQPLCFVTPEPSLKDQDYGIYTPPPSRLEVPKKKARKVRTEKVRALRKSDVLLPNEKDDFDRILDLIQWHAPLALVPLAFGCWATGTVPLISTTFRFIFA